MGKGVDKELNIYLENILKDVDPNVSLDEDQKKVVLTDSKFSMVIAGAGAGKSKTIEARVKYLVDKEGIAPDKILVLSFTNKAVDELKKDFQTLGIQCDVKTFHKLGNEIIGKQVIADRDELESSIKHYLEESVLTNKALLRNMILFLGCYFKPSKEIEFTKEFDEEALNKYVEEIQNYRQFITLRGSLDKVIEGRKEKHKTIQNEYLRSRQEVDIANFFYIHGIDYEYEPLYRDSQGERQDIPNSTKPYTPDFSITIGDETIYVEHFALSDQGKNLLFTKEQIAKYKQGIKDKIQFHKEHGTKLIYTYSEYEDQNCDYIDKLREELVRIGPWNNAEEFEESQSSDEEILKKIIATEDNPYIKGLTGKIKRFIEAFRTNGYDEEKFDEWENSPFNVRTKLFLSLCRGCLKEYIGKLVDGKTDFAGMINDAVKALKESNKDIQYDYIIVDEYQDISEQRFKLIQELVNYTGARLMAVGDDWQTIYSFSGSKLSLFKGFIDEFKAEDLYIRKTYRNSQNLIDVAGAFIMKNGEQIPKELDSGKEELEPGKEPDKPIKIVTYSEGDSGKRTKENIANTVVEILQDILEETSKSRKKEIEILILGRYQLELNSLKDSLKDSEAFEIIEKDHPELDIEYMTVHKSKGLGRDYVIVLNGKNDTFGFPTQIEEDPIFRNVIEVDDSIEYAEERRLFYVALTRTKNKVYLLAPRTNTSEFILELVKDYGASIECVGEEFISAENLKDEVLKCPVCGFPLWHGKENPLGIKGLYVCSNEPEVCDFMTNNKDAVQYKEADICKCNKCKDGWLIVKKLEHWGNDELDVVDISKGCTNYKRDGTGCNEYTKKTVGA